MRTLTNMALACLIAIPATAIAADCLKLDDLQRRVARYEQAFAQMQSEPRTPCGAEGPFSEFLCGNDRKLDRWYAAYRARLVQLHEKLRYWETVCGED